MAPLTIFIAFLSGVIPSLIWVSFWLLEDRRNPEPKKYILLCFLAGMAAVGAALPLESGTMNFLSGTPLLISWAACEEILKFLGAYIVALRLRVFDEPLDAVIYMVTVALGFSALENALFLLAPLREGDIYQTVVTGDLRFVGAMLLHTLASATIGISLALSFYKSASLKRIYAFCGLILAIILHTLFNFFILGTGGGKTFWIFLCIWIGIVALLLLVERVKRPLRASY